MGSTLQYIPDLGEFIRINAKLLKRYVGVASYWSADRDEVYSDLIAKMATNRILDTYDPAKSTIQTYVSRIIATVVHDRWVRKRRRQAEILTEDGGEPLGSSCSMDPITRLDWQAFLGWYSRKRGDHIKRAMRYMRMLDTGLNATEISVIDGISRQRVHQLLISVHKSYVHWQYR